MVASVVLDVEMHVEGGEQEHLGRQAVALARAVAQLVGGVDAVGAAGDHGGRDRPDGGPARDCAAGHLPEQGQHNGDLQRHRAEQQYLWQEGGPARGLFVSSQVSTVGGQYQLEERNEPEDEQRGEQRPPAPEPEAREGEHPSQESKGVSDDGQGASSRFLPNTCFVTVCWGVVSTKNERLLCDRRCKAALKRSVGARGRRRLSLLGPQVRLSTAGAAKSLQNSRRWS